MKVVRQCIWGEGRGETIAGTERGVGQVGGKYGGGVVIGGVAAYLEEGGTVSLGGRLFGVLGRCDWMRVEGEAEVKGMRSD